MPAAKRRAAAALAVPPVKKVSNVAVTQSEEDVFATRVATHLREFASSRAKLWERRARDAAALSRDCLPVRLGAKTRDDLWTAHDANDAVRAAVKMLPPRSGLRLRLESRLDSFCDKVVGKVVEVDSARARLSATVDSESKNDVSETARRLIREASAARRDDFQNMTLADVSSETHRRLLVASFDAPVELGEIEYPSQNTEIATARDASLNDAMDAAAATANKFVDDLNSIAGSVRDKSARRTAKAAFVESAEAKQATRVVARAFAVAALRNTKGAGGTETTDAAKHAAAQSVLARHVMRRAVGRVSFVAVPATATTRCKDTPGRDAALACRDDRVFLIRTLAKRVPDDVCAGVNSADPANAHDAPGGLDTKQKKSKKLVGEFGVKDLPLFLAALGIGGFDDVFERKAVSGNICNFSDVTKPFVGSNQVGPVLLPSAFGVESSQTSGVAPGATSAFAPNASLSEIVKSYELAMAGDPFDDGNDDGTGKDDDTSATGKEKEEELVSQAERLFISSYFDFLKIVRAAAALTAASGDRRGAENLARFAARVPCPPPLLVHLPTKITGVDPRAASVELAACGQKTWRETIAAKNETLAMLGGGDGDVESPGGFFLDAAPGGDLEMDRATDLAETLGDDQVEGGGLQGDALTTEEEEDLAAMLKSHAAGLEQDDDDDAKNLADEQEMARTLNLQL